VDDAAVPDAGGSLTLDPTGVVGVVRDTANLPVSGGRVYLIPAADVQALQAVAIDLSASPQDTAALTSDEPIEDLLDANEDGYASSATDEAGSYHLADLAEGSYFIAFRPAAADPAHLPGGDRCRKALASASFVGTQLDIRVSNVPSQAATYVGSSTCLTCHGRHRSFRTAHRNGLRVPGVSGPFQDLEHWPDFDAALARFDAGTTLYFYDCDAASSNFSKCKVSETDPTPARTVSFEVLLERDDTKAEGELGHYYMRLTNRINAEEPVRHDIALTYGGAVYKQRYVARLQHPNGSVSHYPLMLQYNPRGDSSHVSANNWPWRDYNSNAWFDYAAGRLKRPPQSKAFDNNCAGCHFTGFSLKGSANDGYRASAVPDVDGDYDFDGDGRSEEINLGCEGCHGPGSEHLESKSDGMAIVSPALLTPEREMMICGFCHSRPKGLGGGGTDAPLSADGLMPRPGLRRSEFAVSFTQRVDGEAKDFHASGDSKSHHQQYSDFLRSDMYRNGTELMTCSSCHDAHGSDTYPKQLVGSADDSSICTGCHAEEAYSGLTRHVADKTGNQHRSVGSSELRCTSCHMVKTISSGAQSLALLDDTPSSAAPVQYLQGDISSHRFNVPLRGAATQQPVATTLACASCHATFLDNPP
jgi:predicted CXXCH cytochrome family protein